MIPGSLMSERTWKRAVLVVLVFISLINCFPALSEAYNSEDASFNSVDSDFSAQPMNYAVTPVTSDEQTSKLLLEFWEATGGPNWHPIRWNFSNPWYEWEGITLRGEDIELELLANNLVGTIPDSLGQLRLDYLSLSSNSLTGTIPSSLCYSSELSALKLSDNNFYGELPACIGNLTDLTQLSVAQNSLSGTIPESLYNCVNLTFLVLNGNNFEGSISPHISQLSNLQSMDLSNNQLNGTLPVEIGQMESIRQILLANNQLEGSFTRAILYPWGSRLSKLVLTNNKFSGNLFPFGYLTTISVLALSRNQFTAPIMQLGLLARISYLDLSYNNISDSFNPAFFQLYTVSDLAYLNLVGNDIRPDTKLSLAQFPLSFSGTTQLKTSTENWSCKTISTRQQELYINVDPSFLNYTHCACIRGFYGVPPNNCYACPVAASECTNGTYITTPHRSVAYPIVNADDLDPEEEGESESYLASTASAPSKPSPQPHAQSPHPSGYYPSFATPNGPNPWGVGTEPVYFEKCLSSLACSHDCLVGLVHDLRSDKYIPQLIKPPGASNDTECGCRRGHMGRKCSRCICRPARGFCFYESSLHCRECSRMWSTTQTVAFGVAALVISFLIASVIHTLIIRSKRQFRSQSQPMGLFKRGLYRILHVRAVGYFKLFLIWIQTLAALVSWRSQSIQSLISYIDIANGNAGGVGLTCLWPALRHRWVALSLRVIFPVTVILLLILSIFVAHIVWNLFLKPKTLPHKRRLALDADFDSSASDGDPGAYVRAEDNPHDVPRDIKSVVSDSDADDLNFQLTPADTAELPLIAGDRSHNGIRYFSARSMAISEILTVLYFFYFGVTLSSLAYFTCEEQAGTKILFLQTFPWMRCDSAEVHALRLATIPIFILYSAGVPILFTSILLYYRKRIHLRVVNDIIGGLYRCYQKSCYGWDIVVLMRRLLLALAIRIPVSSYFHSWCVVLVLSVFLALQFWFQPFHRKGENRAEEVSLLLLIITFVSQPDELSVEHHEHATVLFWLTSTFNLIFAFGVIGLIFRAWWTSPLTFDEDDDKYLDQKDASS